MAVDLYWIPLGAGGHSVAFNGRMFEALAAARAHRRRCAIYHAALIVGSRGEQYAIELAPSPDGDGTSRGVAITGPVGTRWAGRLRLFRYELRCNAGGTIPDLAYAAGGPVRVSRDEATAERILALTPQVPALVWGRDERHTGEMWNSNSVIAWLLASAGLAAAALHPPRNGRAPGWAAGLALARDERRACTEEGADAHAPREPEWHLRAHRGNADATRAPSGI